MSETVRLVLFIFIFFGVPGIIAARLAFTKGRNPLGWFLLCFFFPPTLMVLLFQGPLREVPGHHRQCPACHEFLPWKNTVCKYCGAPQPGGDRG